MVNIVDAELKMEVSDDMSAASITANISPAIPESMDIKLVIVVNTDLVYMLTQSTLCREYNTNHSLYS